VANQTKVDFKWHPEQFLNELNSTLQQKLDLTGKVVEQKAKENCPVDTGKLRNSIKSELDKADLTVSVGSDLEYAKFVEYGTRYQPAQSFLRKGMIQAVSRIKAIFSRP